MEKYKIIRSELRDQHINNSFIGLIGSFMILSALALIFLSFENSDHQDLATEKPNKKFKTELIDPDMIQNAINKLMGEKAESKMPSGTAKKN